MTVPSSQLVTKSNQYSQFHANFFNLINNRSNIPDPVDSTGARKFVHVREPNFESRNFSGFPCIIVPRVKRVPEPRSLDATKSAVTVELTITLITADKDANSSGDPSGAQQSNEISTNIVKTLEDATNRKTLRNNGIAQIKVIEGEPSDGEIASKHVFIREWSVLSTTHMVTG